MIRDQTDYLSHKAQVIADQDLFDALDVSEAGPAGWFPAMTRSLYQCTNCGRLWFETHDDRLVSFVPEGDARGILGSVFGERWKAPLRASWEDSRNPPGMLSVARGIEQRVIMFSDWDELAAMYHRILTEREEDGTLRDAMLTRNGQAVHVWSPSPRDTKATS